MPEIPLRELLPIELRTGLTPSETILLEKVGVRAPAAFVSRDEEHDHRLRAKLLYWLCTDADASKHIHAKGVWVEGATVEGVLDFEGATLLHPLWLINCVIPEEIVFRDAQTRSIKLSDSRTGSISADRLTACGFVELMRIKVNGKISLSGADIAGTLNCEGAVIDSGDRDLAVRAHQVNVRGDVVFRYMRAHGTVRLTGAKISGNLECDSAVIKSREKNVALHADRITASNVFLRRLQTHGTVRLVGARINGDLSCDHASFLGADEYSLNARNLTVAGTFFWRRLVSKPSGVVRLLHAKVGQLTDDVESWPDPDKLIIEGFAYGGFGPSSPQTAAERLRWIGLQRADRYRPQSYEQLADVFRSMGREVDARMVLIAKQEARRTQADLNRRTKAWLWFLGKSIRYGYEPWRVVGFMVGMILIGWGVFSGAEMTPTTSQFKPLFNPFIYSFEVFVPLMDLHQERYYLPSAAPPGGVWFRSYFWLHIILGWVSSTLLVAALTGLIRRD